MIRPSPFSSFSTLLAGAAVLTAGCGGSTAVSGDCDASAPDSSPDSPAWADVQSESHDEGGVCGLDTSGTFVFHVHNGGSRMLAFAYGCGAWLPMVLDTPSGSLPISPSAADGCGFICDDVYSGAVQGGLCTDCGSGNGQVLAPGMTLDATWDRRTYTEIMTKAQCSGGASQPCAWGTRVAPVVSQAGVLTVCTQASWGPYLGTCDLLGSPPDADSLTDAVHFTIDTTKSEGTIELP